MFETIYNEIDVIADNLEKRGFKKLAARLDTVSNSLESYEHKVKKQQRAAAVNDNDSLGSVSDGPPPGSEDADEEGRGDSFVAEHYHKVPVGNDSVSRMLGTPSPADMLSRLDFADEGKVNLQARRRKATELDKEFDEGDPMEPFTTAGLPSSGDEDKQPPVDKKQKGETLEFFGTEPAGSLHMPKGQTTSDESDIERMEEEAEEDGQLSMNPAKQARKILREAAKVEVKSPKQLLEDEEGDDVERDQSLGGLGRGASEILHYEDQPNLGLESNKVGSFAERRFND